MTSDIPEGYVFLARIISPNNRVGALEDYSGDLADFYRHQDGHSHIATDTREGHRFWRETNKRAYRKIVDIIEDSGIRILLAPQGQGDRLILPAEKEQEAGETLVSVLDKINRELARAGSGPIMFETHLNVRYKDSGELK